MGAGVRLILEEMRDLKREAAEDRKQFLEYCRRADEYSRRADEDREQAARDRKETHRLIDVIARIGGKILKTQQEHTRLLKGIEKRLGSGGNGR